MCPKNQESNIKPNSGNRRRRKKNGVSYNQHQIQNEVEPTIIADSCAEADDRIFSIEVEEPRGAVNKNIDMDADTDEYWGGVNRHYYNSDGTISGYYGIECDGVDHCSCSKENDGACKYHYHHLSNIDIEKQKSTEATGSSSTKQDEYSCSNYQKGYVLLSNRNNFSNSFDCRLFLVTLQVNGMAIDFEIDTGSAISALPFNLYEEKFGNVELKSFKPALKAYNGFVIEVAGCIDVTVKYKGMSINSVFVVIKKGCRPLIGRDIFRKLRFGIDINTISSSSVSVEMQSNFKSLFSDKLGTYNVSKISLELKSSLKPIFIKPRVVPLAYKEKLESELDRLEKDGVISKVENCEYGSPLVCVMKKDGKLRVCADYSATINPSLEDFNYPLPRIDDLLRALQGGKHFSKIDLSQAYLQLPVDENTSKILAWSTHKGQFVPNRLPFGCKPNTAIFQAIMEKTLVGCEGTCVFVDDVVVTGKNDEDHKRNLRKVLAKLESVGFTANINKCDFFQDQISYLGYIIDKNGLRKDEKKIEAIVNMPRPKNEKEIKAFCGMVIYYGRFMQNLSSVLKPLYDCIKLPQFKWTSECERSFDSVKKLIVSDVVLAHFDPQSIIVLTTDSSDSGIGACVSQIDSKGEEKPVAFASRVLSKAEKNYSAIDREALGIYYGVKKFEQFLMGRKFQNSNGP